MKKKTNKKIDLIIGLGQKKSEYRPLSKYLNIVEVDWNTCKTRTKIGKVDTLMGFSLGCAITCWYAQKYKVKHLILCSPSPMGDLRGVKADKITFMVGSNEHFLLEMAKRLYKKRKEKKDFIVIPKAGHKITGNYRKQLLQLISQIQFQAK